MHRRLARYTLPLLLLGLLSACGFQLRGTGADANPIPDEWKSMHLITGNPNGEFAREVKTRFAANGVQWQERGAANYTLHLGPERMERRNLSIDRNARAAEFELTLSTSLRVTDSEGQQLLDPEEIRVHKIMTHDPENVTGKVEEERLLRREMRTELVQRLMRKVRFLATTSTATTTASTASISG